MRRCGGDILGRGRVAQVRTLRAARRKARDAQTCERSRARAYLGESLSEAIITAEKALPPLVQRTVPLNNNIGTSVISSYFLPLIPAHIISGLIALTSQLDTETFSLHHLSLFQQKSLILRRLLGERSFTRGKKPSRVSTTTHQNKQINHPKILWNNIPNLYWSVDISVTATATPILNQTCRSLVNLSSLQDFWRKISSHLTVKDVYLISCQNLDV